MSGTQTWGGVWEEHPGAGSTKKETAARTQGTGGQGAGWAGEAGQYSKLQATRADVRLSSEAPRDTPPEA